jgi:hypothetical protein
VETSNEVLDIYEIIMDDAFLDESTVHEREVSWPNLCNQLSNYVDEANMPIAVISSAPSIQ